MKNNLRMLVAGMMTTLMFCGCDERNPIQKKDAEPAVPPSRILAHVEISVGGKSLLADFEDNPTSHALLAKMPMTLEMLDLYGREMCHRFGADALPTGMLRSDGYEVGDIAYWPPAGSLVILYRQNGERFERQHIGHVLKGVEMFDGIGTVKVDFKVKESAEKMTASKVKMNIGGREFTICLEDTEAARELVKRLPLSLEMTELNGNEKYVNLASPLPTSVEKVGKIETGDVMLWGDDCLVVFYKSFVTSYSYTRIGRVTNADDLAKAVGKGNVTIDFKAADE